MGTRNLICVVSDNEFKVAQYCQWDGYPTGQGQSVVEFIKNNDMVGFKEIVSKVEFVDDTYIDKLQEKVFGEKKEWITMDESDKFRNEYPQFHRDCGSEILELIYNNGIDKVVDSRIFAGDSLFCEWAYVVDLDNNVLEIYKGFNSKTPKGRFKDFESSDDDYKPVTLYKKIPFKDLELDTMEKLEQEIRDE